MATFDSFEDIKAWQKARELAQTLYEVTDQGTFSKDFGLRDQLRRAGVSVMSNVAEGFERGGNREFIHFLSIAKGSAGEVRAQLILARDLGYLEETKFEQLRALATQTSRLIGGLINYLRSAEVRGPKYKKT